MDKLVEEINILAIDRSIAQETRLDKINLIVNTAINVELDNYLKKSQIELNDQQKKKLWHQIRQDWIKAGLQGLDIIVKGRLKDIGKGMKDEKNQSSLSKEAYEALLRNK